MRILIFTFAVAMIALPIVAHSQTGCLSGVVVDDSGQPIKGMRVGLAVRTWNGQQPVGSAVTDEAGEFEINDIPPGNYELGANNDDLGYPGTIPLQQVSVSLSRPCTAITYNAGPRAAKLKFRATDGVTGKAVTRLMIRVTAAGQGSSWMPAEGLLSAGTTVPPLVPSLSKLHIEITAKGYHPSTIDLPALRPGEMREVGAVLRPEYLGCITGTVTDDSFAPVNGVKIDPRRDPYSGDGDSTVMTDEKGRFRADRLRPGDYDLYPENEAEGFSLLWVGWLNQPELPKLVRVAVPATGVCKNVKLNLGPRGAWLDVVAVDANTREPLSKLIITVNNSEHTRQGGSAYLVEQRPVLVPSHARFAVQVRADGYRTSDPAQIEPLIPGEKKELTVSLKRQPVADDNSR